MVLFSTVDQPVNQRFLSCDFLLVYCCQSVMKVLLGASASVMSRTMAERKLRSIHSKNLYKQLDNFSTAFMNKMKRRKIRLLSGKYFEVERLIVERKSKEEVSRTACHSFSLHAFFLNGYIFAPLKKQEFFLSFGKEKG